MRRLRRGRRGVRRRRRRSAAVPPRRSASAARRVREPRQCCIDAGVGHVRDHDLGRIGARPGKVALEREEPLLRREAVGKRGDAARPDVHPQTGSVSATSAPADTTALSTGRRSTRRTIAPQKRPSGLEASSRRRPTIGRRSASTRSPRSPSSAGSNVSAASTETMPTRIAPAARLRMIEFGTRNIPNIAITKTLPLKSTARLAVAPAVSIAACFSVSRPRSSR